MTHSGARFLVLTATVSALTAVMAYSVVKFIAAARDVAKSRGDEGKRVPSCR